MPRLLTSSWLVPNEFARAITRIGWLQVTLGVVTMVSTWLKKVAVTFRAAGDDEAPRTAKQMDFRNQPDRAAKRAAIKNVNEIPVEFPIQLNEFVIQMGEIVDPIE